MSDKFPRASPRILARSVQGETILYHPGRGAVHVLNAAGGRVWEACDGTRTVAEIARDVRERSGAGPSVSLKKIEADVRKLLAELNGLGLLEWRGAKR